MNVDSKLRRHQGRVGGTPAVPYQTNRVLLAARYYLTRFGRFVHPRFVKIQREVAQSERHLQLLLVRENSPQFAKRLTDWLTVQHDGLSAAGRSGTMVG